MAPLDDMTLAHHGPTEHSLARPTYEIRPYQPADGPQVAELLEELTRSDATSNLAYLQWKYEQNPYVIAPPATVALCGGAVVGFRGLFVLRYVLPRSTAPQADAEVSTTLVASVADVIVHPNHRRIGLWASMANEAERSLPREVRLFLATTVSRNSLPFALKTGYVVLAPRRQHSRYTPLGLMRWVTRWPRRASSHLSQPVQSAPSDVYAVDVPLSADMASIIADTRHCTRIRLLQDRQFFDWRYRNPARTYSFYYLRKQGRTCAYLVVGRAINSRRGVVLDHGARDLQDLDTILSTLIQSNPFDILSIDSHGLDPELATLLQRLGFHSSGLLPWLAARHGDCPLLVRTATRNPRPADLVLNGVDIRHIENWSLKPASADDR